MSDAKGSSTAKSAGLLAGVVTVVTLLATVGKDAYDRYAPAKEKSEKKREDRRTAQSQISHLGLIMGEARAFIEYKQVVKQPLSTDDKAKLDDLSQSGKSILKQLTLSDHYRPFKTLASFLVYDKDVNLALRDPYGEKAFNLYQLQELTEEACNALARFSKDGEAVLWAKTWSPRWTNYAKWLKIDVDLLKLKAEIPTAIDFANPPATIKMLREVQSVAQRAIEANEIPQ